MNSRTTEQLRIPPHSIESEQSVIGAVLISHDAFELVSDIVKPEHFYNRSHAIIFKAITDMFMKSLIVDLVTLSDFLEEKNLLEEVGGMAYLAELGKNTPSSANCAAYAQVVCQRSVVRGLISAAYTITDAGYNPGGRTSGELLLLAESELTKVAEGTIGASKDTSILEANKKFMDKLEIASRAKGLTGISTGLIDLDKKTGGLQDSDLIIVAARPSMGKTTFALNMANHASKQGKKVIFFSLEMPKDQIALKICSEDRKIPITALRTPSDPNEGMTDEDHTNLTVHLSSIIENNRVLDIDDRGGINLIEMRTAIKRFERKHGTVDAIYVDYLQIMGGAKGENKTQQITDISNGLKRIAKEFDCPVVALSQLNRGLEQRADKRPMSSDLRESGAIEQDADVILFIYRDEVYDEQTVARGIAEIIIGKQRNGPLGTVKTMFAGQFSSFRNLTPYEVELNLKKEAERPVKARKYASKGLEL